MGKNRQSRGILTGNSRYHDILAVDFQLKLYFNYFFVILFKNKFVPNLTVSA